MALEGQFGSRLASCLGLIGMVSLGLYGQVMDPGWSEPIRLSTLAPEEGESDRAQLVTGRNGDTHAVWAERLTADRRVLLRYACFDGDSWSDAVLIYQNRPGTSVGPANLTIDAADRLHLTWTEANTDFTIGLFPAVAPIMYTRVAAADALDAEAWQEPTTINATAVLNHLEVDAQGTNHLVYSDGYSPQPGIFYLRSEDDGATWSQAVRVDLAIPAGRNPHYSQLKLDGLGGLHAVWEYKSGWQTSAILYNHSLDSGISWATPITLDEVTSNPDEIQYGRPLLAVHGETVHVIWAGGGFANVGRRHRYSMDRGRTWSGIDQLFGDLHAFTTSDAVVTDQSGTVHFADLLRFPQGLYHAHWLSEWSEPTLVYMNQAGPSEPVGDRIHMDQVNLAARPSQIVTTFTNEVPPIVLYAMYTLLPGFASVSSASYAAGEPLAPDSISAGFGTGLSPDTAAPGGLPLPLELAGTSVEVVDSQGVNRTAPIFYMDPSQINYLIPGETARGPARVRVRGPDGLVAASSVEIANVSPALYTVNAQGTGVPVGSFVRIAADSSRTEGLLFDLGTLAPAPLDVRSDLGQVFVALYGTGLRGFQSQVTSAVDGIPVPVVSVLPEEEVPGLDVVQIGPLPSALTGRGQVVITLTADGRTANPVAIVIE